MKDVTVGEDGRNRCVWGASSPEYRDYHDNEWGHPVGDDNRVYEKLCLEGFQAGLSWLTILRKRDAFRDAFAGFDPAAVADFDTRDVERLAADSGIVRNRAKIVATIGNARATLSLWDEGISLGGLVWQHRTTNAKAPKHMSDLPSTTDGAKVLSADLRRRGFTFVGPTTVYSTMQSLGVVNDHLQGCDWRDIADKERAEFVVPGLEKT